MSHSDAGTLFMFDQGASGPTAPAVLLSGRSGTAGNGGARGLLSPAGFVTQKPGDHRFGSQRGGAVGTPTPLPLATLVAARARGFAFCAAAIIDQRGRLSDRGALKELDWDAGASISIAADSAAAVVVVRAGGCHAVTRDGYLRLPAQVRRMCRIDGGERVLMLAYPGQQSLVVYLPVAVEAMVSAYHIALNVGEPR